MEGCYTLHAPWTSASAQAKVGCIPAQQPIPSRSLIPSRWLISVHGFTGNGLGELILQRCQQAVAGGEVVKA